MKKIWIAAAAIFLVIAFLILTNSMIAAKYLKQNFELQQQVTELEEANRIQRLYYEALAEDNEKLQNKIKEYQEIMKLKAESAERAEYGIFKSVEDYTEIHSPEEFETGWVSPQWELNLQAFTDERGFRKVGEYYCIAIGKGWGYSVKTKVLVVLSTGYTFKAIVGDHKRLADTDPETHKKHISDGSVVEFIVDRELLQKNYPDTWWGIHECIPEFAAAVVGIYKIEN
jgi:hypothetical protein